MRFNEFRLDSNALLIIATVMLGAMMAFVAALTTDDNVVIFGIAYATAFLAICWRYPHVALAITFMVSPFQEDLSGGFGPFRFSLGEISLMLATGIFLFRAITQMRAVRLGPTFVPIAVYLMICLASSLADWHQETVIPSMLQMFLYFIVAVTVYSNFVVKPEQLRLSLYALVLSCTVLAVAGLATGSFYIWGLHKNGAGGSLASGLIICVELWFAAKGNKEKAWVSLALILISAGLIFTLSRGAWLAALSGVFVVLVFRGKLRFVFQMMIVLLPLVAIFWNLLPDDKKDYATDFSAKNYNISARYQSIEFARAQFQQSPLYGVGVGLRKEYDATNIFWVTLAETGVPGLLAFIAIHATYLMLVRKTQRMVPRDHKMYSLLVVGAGLVVGRLVHGVVDHYWSRGALLVAWAGAGMSVSVYFHVRRQIAAADAARKTGWRTGPAITARADA